MKVSRKYTQLKKNKSLVFKIKYLDKTTECKYVRKEDYIFHS